MTTAFGGWVLDQHAVAAWARTEPYPQSLVWSAMHMGMGIAVPVATLPLAYAATRQVHHDVLHALLDLPVTLLDPLDPADAPQLGALLVHDERNALRADALVSACVVQSSRRRGWPVLTGDRRALHALDPDLQVDELP